MAWHGSTSSASCLSPSLAGGAATIGFPLADYRLDLVEVHVPMDGAPQVQLGGVLLDIHHQAGRESRDGSVDRGRGAQHRLTDVGRWQAAEQGEAGVVDRVGIDRGGSNAAVRPAREQAEGPQVPEGQVSQDSPHGLSGAELQGQVFVGQSLHKGDQAFA